MLLNATERTTLSGNYASNEVLRLRPILRRWVIFIAAIILSLCAARSPIILKTICVLSCRLIRRTELCNVRDTTITLSYDCTNDNLTLYSAKAIILPRRMIWSWYSGCCCKKRTVRSRSSPRPLLAVPNVTAHPSTASTNHRMLYSGRFLCGFNVPIKGFSNITLATWLSTLLLCYCTPYKAPRVATCRSLQDYFYAYVCCTGDYVYVLSVPSCVPSTVCSVLRFAKILNGFRWNSREVIITTNILNDYIFGEIGTGTWKQDIWMYAHSFIRPRIVSIK